MCCALPRRVGSSQCTQSWLVLASTERGWRPPTTEEVGNLSLCLHYCQVHCTNVWPTGLQSHAAPFSWKLVFEHDHQLYEMIMTACTAKEETEWRAHLGQSTEEELEVDNSCIFGTMDLDIKSMGAVFGKPGTFLDRYVHPSRVELGSDIFI